MQRKIMTDIVSANDNGYSSEVINEQEAFRETLLHDFENL